MVWKANMTRGHSESAQLEFLLASRKFGNNEFRRRTIERGDEIAREVVS